MQNMRYFPLHESQADAPGWDSMHSKLLLWSGFNETQEEMPHFLGFRPFFTLWPVFEICAVSVVVTRSIKGLQEMKLVRKPPGCKPLKRGTINYSVLCARKFFQIPTSNRFYLENAENWLPNDFETDAVNVSCNVPNCLAARPETFKHLDLTRLCETM